MQRLCAVLCIASVTGCGSGDAEAPVVDAAIDVTPGEAAPIFPTSCGDGLQNGDETDVDCGGLCPRCAGGRACELSTDCEAGACYRGSCAPLTSSCRALHEAGPSLPTGSYVIKPGSSPIPVYCDMTSDGGGWALAFKVDGAASTWSYANAVWSDDSMFGSNDLSASEAKLPVYALLPFTQLRVVMRDAGADRGLVLTPTGLPAGGTLRSVFASGVYYPTTASRAGWLGLVASGSLQTLCNQQGLNNNAEAQAMRVGIFGNQEADCKTCDSRLGIGYRTAPTSGNVASAAHDDSMAGGRSTTTFSFVFVR